MLELARGLSATALQALADLERLVVAADGGRLKLDPAALRSRTGHRAEDVLWWEDGRLLGFLGLYSHGSPLELAGMVAPDARGRGIGGALLDAGLQLCRDRDPRPPLLVVPRPSEPGRALALRRGGVLHHGGYALVLSDDPGPPRRTDLTLRPAGAGDAGEVARLLAAGFGGHQDAAQQDAAQHDGAQQDGAQQDGAQQDAAEQRLAQQLAEAQERTLLVLLDGAPVGTLRLSREGDEAGVYGFVIDPAMQGRGIGRDVLVRVCSQLLSEGARRVGLEVAVDNERALGLYTSVGFVPVAIEDYYAVPTS